MSQFKFKKVGDATWEMPREGGMRVPARIYGTPNMLDAIRSDQAPQQAANVAHLPGIVNYSLAMPDIHWGYGFPIGGVAAFREQDGVISPGGVGYDINCGVRLLATHMEQAEITPWLDDLASALYANCPSGVGKGGSVKLKSGELDRLLEDVVAMAGLPDGFLVDAPQTLPAIHAQRSPLEHVFLNLITNAVKHHDRDAGWIMIRCDDEGDRLRFRIQDDGPGVPEAHRERILQRFYRIPGSAGPGSGLGLSIAGTIAEVHGGILLLEDARSGQGLLARVDLPSA